MRALVLGSATSTLPGRLSGQRNQFADRRRRERGVCGDHHRQHAGQDDGFEVGRRVEARRRVQEGVLGVRGVGAHHQGVAVRCSLGGGLGADVATGAALVFDVEGLPQRPGELLREMACRDVGALPGGVGDDDAHAVARVRLCRGEHGHECRSDQDGAPGALQSFHGVVSSCRVAGRIGRITPMVAPRHLPHTASGWPRRRSPVRPGSPRRAHSAAAAARRVGPGSPTA